MCSLAYSDKSSKLPSLQDCTTNPGPGHTDQLQTQLLDSQLNNGLEKIAAISNQPHQLVPIDPCINNTNMKTTANNPNCSQQPQTLSPPILMAEARNAKNRYLVGSQGGTHWMSLLGRKELDRLFPNNRVSIFVGCWNMAGKRMDDKMLEEWLLPSKIEHLPDVYAIGIQEGVLYSLNFEDWEVTLQRVIGPTHVMFDSVYLGVQHLAVFVRRELVWHLSNPARAVYSTKIISKIRTKGAIAIALHVFGTSFLFLSCHFAAHTGKIAQRVNNYHKLVKELCLDGISSQGQSGYSLNDITDNFDVVFWFGDVNFRLEMSRQEFAKCFADHSTETSRAKFIQELLRKDELTMVLEREWAFEGFREAPVTFFPTFKYDIGTNRFDTSLKQRTPSYTDRILYKCKNEAVDCCLYDSVPQLCVSDHKPVYGTFAVTLRPGKDHIVPSGGQFRRDIFMRGLAPCKIANQGQSEALYRKISSGAKTKSASSKVCTIL